MKTRRGFAFLMMATALTGVPGAAQSNSSSAAGTCSRSNTPSHQLKLESSEKTIRDEMALALHRMQQNTLTREERRSMAELIRPETGQSGELDRVLRQLREPALPEAELSRRLDLEHQRWTAIPAMADALEAEVRQMQPPS